MNTQVRRKLEMAARVREFSRAHPSTDPGYGLVLGRLEERLTRAEAIAGRQHDGLAAARGARAHREELRRVLHFQLLRYLTAVGKVAARDRAELSERFKLPSGKLTNRGFVVSVKAMLASAESQRDALVAEGMSPALLEDLAKKVTELEAAAELARTGRRDHIGARTDLDVVTAELLDQVKVLDGINRYRFGKDLELMAEWAAAKHVPGTPLMKGAPPPSGGEVVPPNPGGIAPAA